MRLIKALLRVAGKSQGKVIAVFAISASDAAQSVRYVRHGAPDVPVWLFSLETPAPETSALCEHVYVRKSSLRLLLAAERSLWPRHVALATAPWNGRPGHWAVKLAPFLIPPFRALLFNENDDSFAATPPSIVRHLRHRLLSDDVPDSTPSRAFQLLRRFSRWVGRISSEGTQKLKPYDVLVFPVIDWDYRFQRPQHLTLELARRGHRVFYISTTFLPAFGLLEPRTRAVANNVYLVDLPGGEDPPDIYRDIPNELQLAALEFGLRSLKQKFAIGATLSIVDYPFWAPLVRRLNNTIVLYDCMDDYQTFRNSGRPARELEPEIIREADVVVCSSTRLQERVSSLGRESILIRNGVDPRHFGPRPASLAISSDQPIVGYHGSITESTDIELLVYAARSLPEYEIHSGWPQ